MERKSKNWEYVYAPWVFYSASEKLNSFFFGTSIPNKLMEFLIMVHIYILAAYLAIREAFFDWRNLKRIKEELEGFDIVRRRNTRRRQKTALVTGADGTIGRKIVELLISYEFKVLVVVMKDRGLFRNFDEERKNLLVFEADLTDKLQVRDVAQRISDSVESIDVAIFAAGVMLAPETYICDDDDDSEIEVHNCVNVISQLAMLQLLFAKIDTSIFLSSATATVACLPTSQMTDNIASCRIGPYQAYSTSKLNLAICVQELSWQTGYDLKIASMHPGTVPGNLYRHANRLVRWLNSAVLPYIMRTPEAAAILVLHTALRDDLRAGQYYEDTEIVYLMERVSYESRKTVFRELWKDVERWSL